MMGILLENKVPYNGVTYKQVYEVHKIQEVGEDLFVFYFIDDNGMEDYINYYTDEANIYNNDFFNIYWQVEVQ